MAEPSSTVIVTTVIDDRDAAERIARGLVDARLAACAQVSAGPVTSVYRWRGEVESAQEYAVAAKTSAARADEVVAAIVAAHSYDTPEVLVTPVLGGHGPYLAWVLENSAPEVG